MRILHINCNYIGTTLHQLMVEHLDALGYENQVFVPTYDKTLAVISPNENVCVCECFQKWDRLLFDYKQQKIRKGLESNLSVGDYDLIHAYTLFTDGNCARNLSKKFGIPYVVAVRNTDVNDFFRLMPHLRSRGVSIMCDAAAVLFLSESYRNLVFEKYIPEEYKQRILQKTYVIPNGIDSFWFQNTPPREKKVDQKSVKLIYAGRIDRNKNIPTTQKAMQLLRAQGYQTRLTVIGKVQDQKEFERISKDPYTNYVPALPKEKLISYYRQADLFVMPSYTESFGLVYAEAMSQGLPVIYSKGQGFDHQFEEGVVGYHVVADDPRDVANGIRRVIDHYSEIQKNVTAKAATFAWESIITEYDRLYQSIGTRVVSRGAV